MAQDIIRAKSMPSFDEMAKMGGNLVTFLNMDLRPARTPVAVASHPDTLPSIHHLLNDEMTVFKSLSNNMPIDKAAHPALMETNKRRAAADATAHSL